MSEKNGVHTPSAGMPPDKLKEYAWMALCEFLFQLLLSKSWQEPAVRPELIELMRRDDLLPGKITGRIVQLAYGLEWQEWQKAIVGTAEKPMDEQEFVEAIIEAIEGKKPTVREVIEGLDFDDLFAQLQKCEPDPKEPEVNDKIINALLDRVLPGKQAGELFALIMMRWPTWRDRLAYLKSQRIAKVWPPKKR